MSTTLRDAIYKAKKYDGLLNQTEYNELMKWVKVGCAEGREACKALATAKSYGYRQFKNIRSRNTYDEERYSKLASPESSGGCYLTSACLTALDKAFKDDCYELETLREFRDTFVKEHYPDDIVYYYKIGPVLVQEINKLPKNAKNSVFQDIYNHLVKPSIYCIENGQLESAYDIYKNYSLNLDKKFLKKSNLNT